MIYSKLVCICKKQYHFWYFILYILSVKRKKVHLPHWTQQGPLYLETNSCSEIDTETNQINRCVNISGTVSFVFGYLFQDHAKDGQPLISWTMTTISFHSTLELQRSPVVRSYFYIHNNIIRSIWGDCKSLLITKVQGNSWSMKKIYREKTKN